MTAIAQASAAVELNYRARRLSAAIARHEALIGTLGAGLFREGLQSRALGYGECRRRDLLAGASGHVLLELAPPVTRGQEAGDVVRQVLDDIAAGVFTRAGQ